MRKSILIAALALAGFVATADVSTAMTIAPSPGAEKTTAQYVDWRHHGGGYHGGGGYHRGPRYRYGGPYRGRGGPYYGRGYHHHRHHGPLGKLLRHL